MEVDGDRNVVMLRRSAAPTVDLADLVAANEQIIARLPPGTAYSGAVVDTQGKRRPATMSPSRRPCGGCASALRTYARVAVIVVSAAGVLQVGPASGRDDEAPTLVTHDEDAALRFRHGPVTAAAQAHGAAGAYAADSARQLSDGPTVGMVKRKVLPAPGLSRPRRGPRGPRPAP